LELLEKLLDTNTANGEENIGEVVGA